MSAYLALARDHEPWPGGESRKRDLNHRLAAGPQASPGPSSSLCFNPASSAARQDTKAAYAAHEHVCFADCTNMGLTGMVFVRGYACRAKPGSCRWACREPQVGMARRRSTKVDGAGMSNGSRIACNSTFKSKRRRAVPAAKPLGKPPRFVVARSANPICRHIWNSICGIAAMLTNRVFDLKVPVHPTSSTTEQNFDIIHYHPIEMTA